MLTVMWSLSAAIRGYMRFYMPSNIAIDLLRTPRGLKWSVPVALVAMPAYLYAMSLCATLVGDGGPGVLNVLVILFFWNAMKFAWLAVVAPVLYIGHHRAHPRRPSDASGYDACSGQDLLSEELPRWTVTGDETPCALPTHGRGALCRGQSELN